MALPLLSIALSKLQVATVGAPKRKAIASTGHFGERADSAQMAVRLIALSRVLLTKDADVLSTVAASAHGANLLIQLIAATLRLAIAAGGEVRTRDGISRNDWCEFPSPENCGSVCRRQAVRSLRANYVTNPATRATEFDRQAGSCQAGSSRKFSCHYCICPPLARRPSAGGAETAPSSMSRAITATSIPSVLRRMLGEC